MSQYELSEKDVNALRAIIDLGVRQGGLQVAEAAAVLNRKLNNPIGGEDEKPDDKREVSKD